MLNRQLTHEDVWWAYRLLLGREPESYDVVVEATNRFAFVADYIDNLLRSDEFSAKRSSYLKLKDLKII